MSKSYAEIDQGEISTILAHKHCTKNSFEILEKYRFWFLGYEFRMAPVITKRRRYAIANGPRS